MRNQRTSTALNRADARLRGFRTIDPDLDLGNNRSVDAFNQLIHQLREKLNEHNDILASLATSKQELRALEKQVNTLSSEMLKGVGFVYGHDSSEYELAGGVKMSDRIRKSRITRLKAISDNFSTSNNTSA